MAESWVRLWAGTTTDPKWQTIARKSGQPRYLVIALFTHMLMVANEAEQRGSVVAMSIEDAASALDCGEDQIIDILHAMEDRVVERGGMLSGWARRQPSREDSGNPETGAKSSTERVREHRQRAKEKRDETQCNALKRDETQCNAPESESDTEVNPLSVASVITASTEAARAPKFANLDSVPTAEVCLGLKAMGYGDTNPHDFELAALLQSGMSPAEILAVGKEFAGKGKRFRYLLKTAEGRRRDAANIGDLPAQRQRQKTITAADERAYTAAALTGKVPASMTVEQFVELRDAPQGGAHLLIEGESKHVA